MATDITQQINFDSLNPLLIEVGRINLIIAAITFIITAIISSTFMVLSVIVGTVIGMVNLIILAQTLRSGFSFKPENAHQYIMKRYYIKLITSMIIIGILISQNLVDPVGLVMGFSIVMITTLSATIYFSKHMHAEPPQSVVNRGTHQGKELA
jgi:hypothetical protein